MKLSAIAIVPLLALAAWQVDLSSQGEGSCDASVDSSCCPAEVVSTSEAAATEECFATEECAGESVTCPPGPDCFAPEVCSDEATVCPASASPAN